MNVVKETHSDLNHIDDDTINLSIGSTERANIFEVLINDVNEVSEPFQTDVSVVVFDGLQYKQNKTD